MNLKSGFCFLSLNFHFIFAQNNTYCDRNVYGKNAQFGTLCLYNPDAFGPKCDNRGGRNVIRARNLMTSDVIAYIVQRHNDLRQRVASGNETRGNPPGQPPATNMNKIAWSDQLALAAQTWAQQCLIQSDWNRNETTAVVSSGGSNPVYVGQNVYSNIEYEYNVRFFPNQTEYRYWDDAINRWYSEVDIFNRDVIRSYTYQDKAGHYTQIVAAETTLIGCGFVQWRKPFNRIARLNICNYGPGGNIAGQPVYNIGSNCTCTTGRTCVDSLCS